ncbi:MAG: Gfo/Idh/MocA family oxidoreductase [Clostridia bacterium]
MIKIGAVTLDTSHPFAFAKIMESIPAMGYTGVFDDSFRGHSEVAEFCERYRVKRCFSLEELAQESDIGLIHSCNWSKHLAYAEPFLRLDKPVFIDKPFVGSLRDCQKAQALSAQGKRLLGSSSLRYATEIDEFLSIPVAQRGEILSVYASCGVDEFNYGIHIVEGILRLVGSTPLSVQSMERGARHAVVCESYQIRFENGANALYTISMGIWQPFVFSILTSKRTYSLPINSDALYPKLLTEIANALCADSSKLATVDELTLAVQTMLAGKQSRESKGIPVLLTELQEEAAFDGSAFYQAYRKSAKPIPLD